MPVRVLSSPNLALGREEVVHALDLKRNITILFKCYEHAAVVTMPLQWNTLNSHTLPLSWVAAWLSTVRAESNVEIPCSTCSPIPKYHTT